MGARFDAHVTRAAHEYVCSVVLKPFPKGMPTCGKECFCMYPGFCGCGPTCGEMGCPEPCGGNGFERCPMLGENVYYNYPNGCVIFKGTRAAE